jgi:hypothetical protein
LGIEDDLNLYAYTHDDSLNGTDPTGEADWEDFEEASAQGLRDAGYKVAEQVRVTWQGAAKGAYSVLDAVGVKGQNIVLLEAKDGLTSKLSAAQKAVFT